jgi:succinylglutamate desuccinylase
MLRILDQLPTGLLDLDAARLADALGGPTLIRIDGERRPALFVSTLLHGNETTGWDAVRALLQARAGQRLPRAMLLFIGNVHAARAGLRRLDGQPDFNRIWNGAPGPEGELAARLLALVERDRPFASIDLHNTSGENPLYACVHRLDDASLALGRVFSEKLVVVTHPDGLLSKALSRLAPSVTLECGKPGREAVTTHVSEFLGDVMVLETLDAMHPHAAGRPAELLRPVATVKVPEHLSFSFDDPAADLRLAAGLDAHNFATMPCGTPIAWVRPGCDARLQALDDSGADVTDRYFRRDQAAVVTAAPVIPSLFTLNERIIRQDCLCYLMEHVDMAAP